MKTLNINASRPWLKRIALLLVLLILFQSSCKKDKSVVPAPPDEPKKTYNINFYKVPSTDRDDIPQITLKNDKVQFTAIGKSRNGKYQLPDKVYFSSKEDQTEWIIIPGENSKPKFVFAINSANNEKLRELYWFDDGANGNFIRYYSYDWSSRLGTLIYEAQVINGEVTITFENEAIQSTLGFKKSALTLNGKNKKAYTVSRSFPSPLPQFRGRNGNVPIPYENLDDDGSKEVATSLLEVIGYM